MATTATTAADVDMRAALQSAVVEAAAACCSRLPAGGLAPPMLPLPPLAAMAAAADALTAAYSEAHRAYHTAAHINECLGQLAAHRDAARDPATLALALLYHDAVYDPRARGNEAASAAMAARDLPPLLTGAGMPADAAAATVTEVARLIMLTTHDAPPPAPAADPDGALLVDIDLSVLAAPRARFLEYDAAIRREYAHVPPADYRAGRAAVLRSFLARPALFVTPAFAAADAAARENLADALARLAAATDADLTPSPPRLA